jgi:hypothetical protein
MVDLTINGGSQTLDGTQTYDYVNITNNGTLFVTLYNGTGTTGRLILNAIEVNVDSTSSINGFARGYRGGVAGTTISSNNGGKGGELAGSGGGGNGANGQSYSGGGGGGGYGTAGSAGATVSTGIGGTGGSIQGTSNGSDIQMGNGAGGGGSYSSHGGTSGGPGGAMLTINAQNINIHGRVNFNGGTGGNAGYNTNCGNGAGASGGGILFNATNVDISSANITALGGASGSVGPYTAGPGGGGRIKIFYSGTYNNSGATISAGTVYTESLAPLTGDLNISSTPSGALGASVYIDGSGTSSGVTPLIVTGFSPGIHTYRLTKTGYSEIPATNFSITAGQTTTISQALLTIANIRAYNMVITPTVPCIEGYCVVVTTITWRNNGESTGSFTPSITVVGVPPGIIDETYMSQSLAGGETSASKIFTIIGLTSGSHSICPNPN